jgi:hypothetical protein
MVRQQLPEGGFQHGIMAASTALLSVSFLITKIDGSSKSGSESSLDF